MAQPPVHKISSIFNTDAKRKEIGWPITNAIRPIPLHPIIVKQDNLKTLLSNQCVTKDGYKVVRFLLRTDNTLVFAAEGTPSQKTPCHAQMVVDKGDWSNPWAVGNSKCITAGNAFFDDKGKLCRINHQSGDFEPPFESLQFALPYFADLPCQDVVEIQEIKKDGVMTFDSYFIDKKELQSSKRLQTNFKDRAEIEQAFHKAHRDAYRNDKKKFCGIFNFFRSSELHKNGKLDCSRKKVEFEKIVTHAQKSNNRSRRVLADLGLMDKKGNTTASFRKAMLSNRVQAEELMGKASVVVRFP